jgi:hypothetical protein
MCIVRYISISTSHDCAHFSQCPIEAIAALRRENSFRFVGATTAWAHEEAGLMNQERRDRREVLSAQCSILL